MKRVLTIAGSDSGGGAGIQADLKTITVLGAYGMSVLTALTAQNTVGVQGVHEVPLDFIRKQLDSVLSDIGADAVKTGMLASSEIVKTVVKGLNDYNVEKLVVDPVMVATSGDRLLSEDAVETVKNELLPLAWVVTPNLSEASLLSGVDIKTFEDMQEAARKIFELGPKHVLIKGGHFEDDQNRSVDLLYDGTFMETFDAPMIDTRNTHGTGCTLSAALASYIAQDLSVSDAVCRAKAFITNAIAFSFNIGSGNGPTNPFAHIEKYMKKDDVLVELREALQTLLTLPVGYLIPEIRANLGYALPGASGYEDVAGVPGRISQIGERLVAYSDPAFGATKHIARVILAAMTKDPSVRSAVDIRYEPEILEACKDAGLSWASFDRRDEPKDVKEREGSSLEWGTKEALKSCDRVPDIIFDEGDVGKEPVIRILAEDPMSVVEKIVRIHDRMTRDE